MGFFDWFRRSKPEQLATAEEYLSLKSTEFPWPKERRTNHARGKKHWQHSYCLGSEKKALEIDFMQSERCIVDKETGALMPPSLIKWGACPSCGRKSRVTSDDRAFHHLPVSSVS